MQPRLCQCPMAHVNKGWKRELCCGFVPHQLSAVCGEGNCVQFPVLVFTGEQGKAFCWVVHSVFQPELCIREGGWEVLGVFSVGAPSACALPRVRAAQNPRHKLETKLLETIKTSLVFCYFQLLSFCLSLCCSDGKRDTRLCLTGTNLRYKIISSMYKFF